MPLGLGVPPEVLIDLPFDGDCIVTGSAPFGRTSSMHMDMEKGLVNHLLSVFKYYSKFIRLKEILEMFNIWVEDAPVSSDLTYHYFFYFILLCIHIYFLHFLI